jgi:hypothetical protein
MGGLSDKKSQAIYDAVHKPLMDLRVRLMRGAMMGNRLDDAIAKAMDQAAQGAVDAYFKPLHKSRVTDAD